MMTSHKSILASAFLTALAAVWCTGCPQMAIVQGATMVAGAAADDRTLDQQAADLDVKSTVEGALLNTNATLAAKVNVDVYLGRIMLTGVVGSWDARRQAVDITRQAEPGHEIFDDMEVAIGNSIADSATDFAVNKDLGVNLLADEGLASQSFQHRVVNGTAFIMGQAQTEAQIDEARRAALQTPGINRVVTHILLR